MRYSVLIDSLQNLTNSKPNITEIANIIGKPARTLYTRGQRDAEFKPSEIKQIEEFYNINLSKNDTFLEDCIPITYRPDVYLSAGYGVEVYDENKETLLIDSKLLVTERGNKINPDNCEVVRVSGNSMSPEYRHGDRVIIDKGDTELLDGHIFAFRYKNCCYVKEMNLLGDRIKCISLNKEYDPFYIEVGEPFTVLGRIIPRVRL